MTAATLTWTYPDDGTDPDPPFYQKVRTCVSEYSGLPGDRVLHFHYTGDLPDDVYCIVGAPEMEPDGPANTTPDRRPNYRVKVSAYVMASYPVMFYNSGSVAVANRTAIAMANTTLDVDFQAKYGWKDLNIGRVLDTSQPPVEGMETRESCEFDLTIWDFMDFVEPVTPVASIIGDINQRGFSAGGKT